LFLCRCFKPAEQFGSGRVAADHAAPINLNYSLRQKIARRGAQKKRWLADSLVPPTVDFGYAEARQRSTPLIEK
jgi:hypothetical protein